MSHIAIFVWMLRALAVVAMWDEHRPQPQGVALPDVRERGREGGSWGGHCVVQTTYFSEKNQKTEKEKNQKTKNRFKCDLRPLKILGGIVGRFWD